MSATRVEVAYRRLHSRLWRALLSYTGSDELASDAEAEAFAQALRRGDDIADVEAWIWKSAFHIAAGLLGDRQFLRRSTAPLVVAEGAEVEDSLSEFLSMLAGLSDQQRAIVALRYVGNFQPAEIARLVDSTAGSVRVQLHRAHAHLRTVMKEIQDV